MSTQRSSTNLDEARALEQFALMSRIRAFEETAIEAFEQQLVLGAIHPSIGQEGIAAGLVTNLRQDDVLLSTHRGHGHTLAKGADALAMMRELIGRQGGNCGGKGGSMHIADFSVGMLGANGVVGANIVIAAGAAHAIKLRGESRIVCCIFGDGAINRGPFLEGLNWARVFDLPVLFVCEDNGFAATTRTRSMTGGEGPAARAQSLGLETATADGNDVLALDALSQRVIERIRNGGGPEFMHLETYRLAGHTASDPALYRPAAEVAARRADDPIARLRDTLVLAGVGEQMLDAIVFQAQEAMARVLDEARNTPFPPAAHAYADVQDVGDPRETAC